MPIVPYAAGGKRQSVPPKKGVNVDLPLKVPFLPEFKERLLSERKTATTRTYLLGMAPTVFEAFGARFVFTGLLHLPLMIIAERYYWEEGFEEPDGFIKIWERIHPIAGWQPGRFVYFHTFKKVGRSQ